MPIEAPQLDDLRFDRTVEELVRRIPAYAPEWTDHNASDPGISLIDLFAYVTEQMGTGSIASLRRTTSSC